MSYVKGDRALVNGRIGVVDDPADEKGYVSLIVGNSSVHVLEGNLQPIPEGSIGGNVHDLDGDDNELPVGGATVTITGIRVLETRVTNADGSYQVDHLPPGTYDVAGVSGELEGSANDIVVEDGETADAGMELD